MLYWCANLTEWNLHLHRSNRTLGKLQAVEIFLAHFAAGRRKWLQRCVIRRGAAAICFATDWFGCRWAVVCDNLRPMRCGEKCTASTGWLISAHSQPPANPFDVVVTEAAAAHIFRTQNPTQNARECVKKSLFWLPIKYELNSLRSANWPRCARWPAGQLIDWHNLPKLHERADRIALLKQMASLFSVRRLITFLLHASAHSLFTLS